ncbi:MAG: perosamine synthetase [Parcubacteria group bacterium Gr01-1014_48]|nr:MAG: perosamine synthetase [Parcubacteria group bacterium Greene0416_14]TSC74476.1 MAG: perosamine synthetase [Parcubacteria group bacterium Gr01-1014_48]TSD01787.1 MAG: perosamine synthetase [Parcubacteria group bacterium Greene1014_15]TSD08501.1 MAG: perosamine synthetase [Parcubacteria group bacterium Greene0714_4]
MSRVGRETIPCYEPSFGQEEIILLTKVIKNGWLSEKNFTREFEEKLARICGRLHALAFSHGTDALITGMKALGIGEGDEVIVPSLAHSADPNAIAATGATPIFADVDENTMCLNVATIQKVRTDKTKAILFIALYGSAKGIDAVSSYARREKLYLVNDCAPALFGVYKKRSIASYGEFSMLSFFADKTITTGEGGMLLTDKSSLIDEANIYKHDGRRERGVDLIERRGYNFRITELQSAVGVAQLKKAPRFVFRKRAILKAYTKRLKGVSEVRVFDFANESDICPHRVVIFVPEAEPLIKHLVARGIGARTLFMPMHSQPCYNTGEKFPMTEKLYKTGVCLPSAPSLRDEQVGFVCEIIKNFYLRI